MIIELKLNEDNMITRQRMEIIIKSPSIATDKEIRELAIVYILQAFPDWVYVLKSSPILRTPPNDSSPSTAYCNSDGVSGGDYGS